MKFDPLIFKRVFATLLLLGAVVVILSMAHPVRGQTINSAMLTSLQYNLGLLSLLPEPVLDPLLDPPGNFHAVKPQEFDPGTPSLVQAAWLHGTGRPTNTTIALPNSTFTGVGGFSTFTNPACLNDFDADSAMHRLSRFRVFSGLHATHDSRSCLDSFIGRQRGRCCLGIAVDGTGTADVTATLPRATFRAQPLFPIAEGNSEEGDAAAPFDDNGPRTTKQLKELAYETTKVERSFTARR